MNSRFASTCRGTCTCDVTSRGCYGISSDHPRFSQTPAASYSWTESLDYICDDIVQKYLQALSDDSSTVSQPVQRILRSGSALPAGCVGL